MQTNLWDTMKLVLMRKFITLKASENMEVPHTSYLTAHLKTLHKKKQTYPTGVDSREYQIDS